MKLIGWKNIKSRIDNFLNFSNQKEYLIELIDNIERKKEADDDVCFKIVSVKEKGFSVKVDGLFAYVSFNHMPWKYPNIEVWQAVSHTMIESSFLGTVYEIRKNPLFILLNGEVPQFIKPELTENEKYNGIITNKTNFGVFVDIGYNFDWKYGSLVGLLYEPDFKTSDLFDKINIGEIIESYFWGYNEKEQLILGKNIEIKEWFTGEIEKLIDVTLPVKVEKSDDNKTTYLVKDKYNAVLQIDKFIYSENRTQINKAVRKLKDGDTIHCRILQINKIKRILQLKWELDSEIEEVILRSNPQKGRIHEFDNEHNKIINRVNGIIIEKLNLIGNIVQVEVLKKEDSLGRLSNKYIIEGKHKGKLSISNENYRISNKEKKQIELNLQDGDVLNCEVLSIEKKSIRVKWNLKDEELYRFLQ